MNGMLLQGFSWHVPADSGHWERIAADAKRLASLGVTAVWLPPAYKGQCGVNDAGYGVYDLYDLGEFEQRGSVATKYGTKEQYLQAIGALHEAGIHVLVDTVLNHKMGADATEWVTATPIDPADRNQAIGPEERIEVWTRFDFPGRADAYSDFHWDWTCFHGTDWDEATQRQGLWLFEGKQWNSQVDSEYGNFDYLMGVDVHLTEPKVMDELVHWGTWYLNTSGADGLRMDALKHMGRDFTMAWLEKMREETGRELFTVGEFWTHDLAELRKFIGEDRTLALFDVPLHFALHRASWSRGEYDLRAIFADTLVDADPTMAVTFVENHDTQEGQSLQSPVAEWFKPAAYALILLREAGYPCVFQADLDGAGGEHPIAPVPGLETLMRLRASHAHGIQRDAFDDPELIGWSREGLSIEEAEEGAPSTGVAVLISQSGAAVKTLEVGACHAGQLWECVLGGQASVIIDEDGTAVFTVGDEGLAVFIPKA